jgi:hypothetical protein
MISRTASLNAAVELWLILYKPLMI